MRYFGGGIGGILEVVFCDDDDVKECDTEGDDDDVGATEQRVVFWKW